MSTETNHEVDERDRAEIEAAAQMIIPLLPPECVVIICSPDMEVTTRAIYATGTQIWTMKPKNRKK